MKNIRLLAISMLVILSLVISGSVIAQDAVKVCQVTDTGGIDDKSFNATAWAGVERAEEELDVEGKYLESQQQTDYESNINAFIEDECDVIITVGFLLGEATSTAATDNPDFDFAIVDFAYDPAFDNVLGMVFNTDEAAFLAGYVAAASTQTGKVATFGGINIPPVTVFMDGFAMGVAYYNEMNDAEVEVLGWDVEEQDGLFTGNFDSTDDGRAFGESLMDEGADIIMPVAGPVGLGTAAAVQERGDAWIIGVDVDWTVSAPDYADIVLTSVLKRMDNAVFAVTESVVNDEFEGGLYIGMLENDGVGISAVNEAAASDELQEELDAITEGIIAGDIATHPEMEEESGD